MIQVSRPLDGLRVLDFTHIVAGPVCSRLLVDLGADVLKIETRKRPDRPWSGIPADGVGRTQAFLMVHRGKKSIAIDLKTEDGANLARRLADVSDVVVENFSAGVMERLGLGYERLREGNPKLVYVSMSGYGHDGPRSDWRSMNSILQAHSGLMLANGYEGAPPISISNSWMDYVGGLHGCFCVLEGLNRLYETGEGSYIDLSQFECSVAATGARLLAGIIEGTPPQRVGNQSSWAVPQNCYRCAGDDAWCAVSIEDDAQWRALGKACGDPPWAGDPRFTDLLGRIEHREAIDAALERWSSQRSAEEVARVLQSFGIPAERVRTAADVHEAAGASLVFRFRPLGSTPLIFSAPPFAFEPPIEPTLEPLPGLGEHTEATVAELLGLEPEEIERLRAAEVFV